jgi:anti-sigma factor RsiW
MKCPRETGQGPEMLLAYSSGELDTETAAAFAEHFRTCAACGKDAAEQQAVWSALGAWEAPGITADFDRRLYARIASEVSWWDRFARPMLVRRGLPVAAALAVTVVAVLVERPALTPASAVPESAQVEIVAPDQAEHALQDMETMRELSRLMHTEAPEPKM